MFSQFRIEITESVYGSCDPFSNEYEEPSSLKAESNRMLGSRGTRTKPFF